MTTIYAYVDATHLPLARPLVAKNVPDVS